ncbi:MAG: threonine--tRNA ligase [Phycisphaerae bacterium]
MSVKIQLPDGSIKEYDSAVTPLQVAEEISAGLARATVAAVVDGRSCDVTTPLSEGTHELKLLTNRDEESLEVLRHSAAHLLAHAMVRLYGDEVKYTIGPALTDDFQYGFYYDFDLPVKIGTEDLSKIEKEMKRIASEKLPVQRVELSPDEAKKRLSEAGQSYKVEMIDDMLAEDPEMDSVSLYEQGEFVDMCRGPHVPDTGKMKVFKLLTTAGAYWRGDESRQMLTRVYGTAFFDKKELQAQLQRIEEARKRDHRVIGKQMGLFLLNDKVGSGLPMWMPKGAVIRQELENWLRGELRKRGYQFVYTPHIGKLELYRTSGHYPYYKESQFPPIEIDEDEGYLAKPMNCPHHMMIYKAEQHSYRDLPVRLAEFGSVYRWEQSGELNGLTRVRGFTQDDAHIICTPDQLEAEIADCVQLTKMVLETLGLTDYHVRVSLRDPDSTKYVGDQANWDLAEQNIRHVVREMGMNFVEAEGEAAFYGPKIDFIVSDCIGRKWQLGTIQVDYNLPERFELEYAGADNTVHRPVMIHRAPFGSLERFIGILIEHFGGDFPLWLAPVQMAVLPVSDKYNDYAQRVVDELRAADLRVDFDNSPEKIGAKIRRATLNKTPYMAIVGGREEESQTVSIRHRTEGDLGALDVNTMVNALEAEVASKGTEAVTAAVASATE